MFSNPSHRYFMQYLDQYYDSPNVEKVKSSDRHAIYMCRLTSLLLNERRFLVVMCQEDHQAIGYVQPLGDIYWSCFQARVLQDDEYHDIVTHSYTTKASPQYTWNVNMVISNKEYSVYRDPSKTYPVEITLLHTTMEEYEYPPSGSFASCLETYQTVLRFIDY